MQILGFICLTIIILAVTLRMKAMPKASAIMAPVLIIAVAVPSYLIFGQPNYGQQNNTPHISFNAVSPEQDMALRSFEILKHEKSQSAAQWHDVAIALRLQNALTRSSYAYNRAAQITTNLEEKASFYGAAGEVLVEKDTGIVSQEAAQLFTKALEHNPKTLGALYYLGLSNETAQNKTAAMTYYRDFLRYAEDGHPRLTDVNARLFTLSGKLAESQPEKIAPVLTADAMNTFKSLPEDQQNKFLQSMMMRRFNTLQTQGGNANEWRDLARYFQRLGNTEQALKTYAQAIAISPDNTSLKLERDQLKH